MRTFLIACTTLLCGCGYDLDAYLADLETVPCSRYDECGMLDFFGGTAESCEQYQAAFWASVQGATEDWCSEYDKATAKECVGDWETISCDDLASGNTPGSCDFVCEDG